MAPSGKQAQVHSSASQASQGSVEDGEHTSAEGCEDQPKSMNLEDGEDTSQEPSTGEYETETMSETMFNSTEDAAFASFETQIPEAEATDMDELSQKVRCYIVNGRTAGGEEIAVCFFTASEEAPITAESLTELDMTRIINNPKLRYDVNFDRELHFRPNLDGDKGKAKMRQADLYWKALEAELFMYGFVQGRVRDPLDPQGEVYWKEVLARCEKRLPKVFDAIREILKTLVPDYDQEVVSERLDSAFIMRQIKNGTCDLIDLANWLGKILKNHCAPMRDPLVDRMQAEIKRGAAAEQSDTLVNGIRQLLTILEAMKLDVANHQIRHMRPLLIEDTVNFQRKYNAHRISMNKVDVMRSRLWLDYEMSSMMTDNHLEALPSALLRGLLFNDEKNLYPSTFYLDAERLVALRTEMHTTIYQELCRNMLVEVAFSSACPPPKAQLAKALANLHVAVSAIVGPSGKFGDRIENIAAEIVRLVLVMEGRNPPLDPSLVAFVEMRLEDELRSCSVVFEKHAQDLFDRLLPRIQASVMQHVNLPALHLQDRLLPPAPLPVMHQIGFGAVCAPPPPIIPHGDPEEDFVRKMTHMCVLHWQVWADLVYLGPMDDDQDGASSSGSRTPPSPSSPLPPLPVAKAVYAPGRKWLPIGVTLTEIPTRPPTPPDLPPLPAPHSGSSTGSSDDEDSSSEPSESSASNSKEHEQAA